jgi:hypothetical protein
MSNARGKRKSVEPTDYGNAMEPTIYEAERNENIRVRIQKMQELNIQPTLQQLNSMQQARKKKKVCIPMNLKCFEINVLKQFYEVSMEI